jgi:hypothetical protein
MRAVGLGDDTDYRVFLLMQYLQRGKRKSGRAHKKNAWLGHGKMSFLFFLEKHIWK